MSVDIHQIKFFQEIDKCVSIARSFPMLTTAFIDWIKSCIQVTCNDDF